MALFDFLRRRRVVPRASLLSTETARLVASDAKVRERFGASVFEAMERRALTDDLARYELRELEGLAWIHAVKRAPAQPAVMQYAKRSDDVVHFVGVYGLSDVLAEGQIDVVANPVAVFTFVRATYGKLLETDADLAALPAKVRQIWEPAHFEGRCLSFFAASASVYCRVVVDGDTLKVTVEAVADIVPAS